MRVVIVDDHAGFRATARRVLEADGVTVLADAADAETARAAVETHRPDVVLVDVALGDGDGVAVARDLAGAAGGPAVVVMSGWDASDLGELGLPFVSKSGLSRRALETAVQR